MRKAELLGKWIKLKDINPIEIEDLQRGDYVVLRVEYRYSNFDYKLGWVDEIQDRVVKFHIQDINICNTPIKITAFCVIADYNDRNNFYKPKNK